MLLCVLDCLFMNLYDRKFTYTFTTEEVVFLLAFFKQFIRKLGQGEFQDIMQRLYDNFRRAVEKADLESPLNSNLDSKFQKLNDVTPF